MRNRMGWVVLGVAAIATSGCRVKSVDSYISATSAPERVAKYNDPYSYGGIAGASGGTKTEVTYGTGARGDHDGAPAYFARMSGRRGKSDPEWTVEGNPKNERTYQFIPPGVGRVKDNPASPFGTLSGY